MARLVWDMTLFSISTSCWKRFYLSHIIGPLQALIIIEHRTNEPGKIDPTPPQELFSLETRRMRYFRKQLPHTSFLTYRYGSITHIWKYCNSQSLCLWIPTLYNMPQICQIDSSSHGLKRLSSTPRP